MELPINLVESIRMRPGMYIGELEPHPLLWELVANCVDIELGGRPVRVEVEIHADGSVSVQDDGPGISLPLEVLMIEGHTTPTADGHAPHVHLTSRGLGLAVVSALSERVEIRTRRGDAMVRQLFSRGTVASELEYEAAKPSFGTWIRSWPDPAVFGRFRWDPTAIQRRLQELAALRVQLSCRFLAAPRYFAASLDLTDLLPEFTQPALHDAALLLQTKDDGVSACVALRWHRPSRWSTPSVRSFCNMRETSVGMHVVGLQRGVGLALVRVAPAFSGKDWRRAYEAAKPSLAAVVAVELIDPRWRSPIKDDPTNPELAAIVEAVVLDELPGWFERHPAVLDEIVP